jgi:tetratricopeptide (TPR) repeat protein
MEVLRQISLELAQSTYSLIPGLSDPRVIIQSGILLAEVQRYPQKRVNDEYAVSILEHKPTVEVSYSVRFIGNRTAMAVLEDPPGLSFIHYVLVPDSITIDSYGDKYFADLRTTVRLADAQGKTLFQQEKSIPIDLRREEMKGLKDSSFQLYDSVPVIPGTWTFSLLLENTVSKEFTTVEKTITVPERGELRMSPLVLARKAVKTEPSAGMSRAYQVGAVQVYPSVNNVFREKDRVFVFLQLSGLSPALKDRGVLEYALLQGSRPLWTFRQNVLDCGDLGSVLVELPAEKLAAGKYSVRAGLRDPSGIEVLAAQTEIEVTKNAVPGLWVVAQANPPTGDPSYGYILGTQYLNKGDVDAALEHLGRACQGKRDSAEYAVGYARALLQKKDAAKAREILLPFVDSKDAKFDFYEALGSATREAGDLKEAVTWYDRALSFRGNVVEALNAMGECYLGLGEKDAAAKMFKKSLEINPNQERIKALLAGIR